MRTDSQVVGDRSQRRISRLLGGFHQWRISGSLKVLHHSLCSDTRQQIVCFCRGMRVVPIKCTPFFFLDIILHSLEKPYPSLIHIYRYIYTSYIKFMSSFARAHVKKSLSCSVMSCFSRKVKKLSPSVTALSSASLYVSVASLFSLSLPPE